MYKQLTLHSIHDKIYIQFSVLQVARLCNGKTVTLLLGHIWRSVYSLGVLMVIRVGNSIILFTKKTIISERAEFDECYILHSVDISHAFINGDIDADVYMMQPEGFKELGSEYVCKLNKSIY